MKLKCDVLVVGAGTAGVPAAVAAARAGADTILVERQTFPGGTGVTAMHRNICGLCQPDGTLIHDGLVREICERITALAPERRPVRLGKVSVQPYSPGHLQAIYTDMLSHEKRIQVRFGTAAELTHYAEGRIDSVKTAVGTICPKVVVDCSGEGVIIGSHPAFHETVPLGTRQLAGLVLQLAGLATSDDMLPIKVPYMIRQGVEAGALAPHLKFSTFGAGDVPGTGWCKLSFPPGTDSQVAQGQADDFVRYLRAELPQFKAARVEARSDLLLEREGVRLKGRYTLTAEDVLQSRQFDDAAARSIWPIELWDPERGPTYFYPKNLDKPCDIPLRCLQSAAAVNLLCAGRCISVTREALGATRVMGTCMALGEAAGKQAARQAGGPS